MKPRYFVDLEYGILLINPYKTDRAGPYLAAAKLDTKAIENIKRIIAETNTNSRARPRRKLNVVE